MILMVSGLVSAQGFCSDCGWLSLSNIFRHLLLLRIGLINRSIKRARLSFIAESFVIDLFLISEETLHCIMQNSSLNEWMLHWNEIGMFFNGNDFYEL